MPSLHSRRFYLLTLVVVLVGRGLAADENNLFLNPLEGANPISQKWTIGQKQTLKWQTNLTDYNIVLWQQDLARGNAWNLDRVFITVAGNGAGTHTQDWTASTGNASLTRSNKFFFWLTDPTSSNGFTSSMFYLHPGSTDEASSGSPTTSSQSPRTTITPSASTPLASTPQPSTSTTIPVAKQTDIPSPAPSPTPNSPTQLLSISLGVSLGLGIPLLIMTVLLAVKCSRRRFGDPQRQFDEGCDRYNAVPPPAYCAHALGPPRTIDGGWERREMMRDGPKMQFVVGGWVGQRGMDEDGRDG